MSTGGTAFPIALYCRASDTHSILKDVTGGAKRNPDTVSHTLFPLFRDFCSGSAARRSLIDPDVLGWPALWDCRMRLTAFLPPHRTDAAGRRECSTTEAWHHRPGVSISPIGTIAPIDDNRSIIDYIDSE